MTGSAKKWAWMFALLLTGRLVTSKGQTKALSLSFENVTAQSGIHFRHENAASGEKYLIETMGGGCAWLDYDGDGWLDAFFVNSSPTPKFRPLRIPRNALFRNNRDGTFTEVTAKAGLEGDGLFAFGAAVGDYDNDSYPDVFVSGYARSVLYHNNRDGTFSDVTDKAGLRHQGFWASSAGWFDYDRDGDLDLFVANYLEWSYEKNIYCGDRVPGHRAYCSPKHFAPVSPTLYRNNGDGTFEDVTRSANVYLPEGKALGVALADLDLDGNVDAFVANDGVRNFLYFNDGHGKFHERGLESGVAYSEDGVAEAGMGVDVGDYDGDGLPDIYVTHLDHEYDRLYRNTGNRNFVDATYDSGLGNSTYFFSGFGTRFSDFDRDGFLDLIVVNGHVLDNIQLLHPEVGYAERPLLFRNTGGKFVNVSSRLGEAFQEERVGRGLAVGDYDNDGDPDLLISNNGGPGELIRNNTSGNHWLEIKLIGKKSNRDAIGARITLWAGGRKRVDQVRGGSSYLSSSDLRVFFGLGRTAKAERIEMRWPSGTIQSIENPPVDSIITIEEAKSTP